MSTCPLSCIKTNLDSLSRFGHLPGGKAAVVGVDRQDQGRRGQQVRVGALADVALPAVLHLLLQVDDRVSDVADDLVVLRQEPLQTVYLVLQDGELALDGGGGGGVGGRAGGTACLRNVQKRETS